MSLKMSQKTCQALRFLLLLPSHDLALHLEVYFLRHNRIVMVFNIVLGKLACVLHRLVCQVVFHESLTKLARRKSRSFSISVRRSN